MKIAAIIPAYNEEKSIKDVIDEVNAVAEKSGLKIIPVVINDCSLDSTASTINKLNCVPIHLPINLGIGGAVQTGFKYAFENNFDYAIQVDGDGQHPPQFIPYLLEHLQQQKLDVVIGSRYITKKGFQSSFIRRIGIRYFKWLNKLFTGIEVADSTSGFRIINRKVLELVVEYYPDEYPEPEAIILFAKSGFKIGEAPVEMRQRQAGVSSISNFLAVYYMLKVTLAIFFTYLRVKNKLEKK